MGGTYANWKGYNLRYVPELKNALKQKKNWPSKSSARAGDVVIFGSDAHACIATSSSTVDCHNNNRCGSTISGIASGFGGVYKIIGKTSLTHNSTKEEIAMESFDDDIILTISESSNEAFV